MSGTETWGLTWGLFPGKITLARESAVAGLRKTEDKMCRRLLVQFAEWLDCEWKPGRRDRLSTS